MKKILCIIVVFFTTSNKAGNERIVFDNNIIFERPSDTKNSIATDEVDDLFSLIDDDVLADPFTSERTVTESPFKTWSQNMLISAFFTYVQCKEWCLHQYQRAKRLGKQLVEYTLKKCKGK